jgi:predicted TIM-barrel fold metal-dependent hydrolase
MKRKPSTAAKERPWYFHTEAEEQMLSYFISVMGDDKVFFASDFPHWDGDYPATVDEMLERKDLSEESQQKVMGENARKLYRLA